MLRMQGVLTSCVHIANPVRYLMSSRLCPPEYLNRVVSDADARRIMGSWLLPVGHWNAAGGLYGLKKAVAAHKTRMAKAFKGIANVQFFSDKKLGQLERLAGYLAKTRIPILTRVVDSLESFKHIHGMMHGIPTDEAYRNILWKVDRQDRFGLIWFAPTGDAKGHIATRIIDTAAPLFAKHGFDMAATITLVTNDRFVAVLNIVFDKQKPEQKARAHTLYHELHEHFLAAGIGTYRSSIMGMNPIRTVDPVRGEVLERIKSVLDPDGVIARGRYGISPPNRTANDSDG